MQCSFLPGYTVHVQPGQCFLQSPVFSVTAKILKFTLFCINNLVTVIIRVLKTEVKLTFWTAISSQQAMGVI